MIVVVLGDGGVGQDLDLVGRRTRPAAAASQTQVIVLALVVARPSPRRWPRRVSRRSSSTSVTVIGPGIVAGAVVGDDDPPVDDRREVIRLADVLDALDHGQVDGREPTGTGSSVAGRVAGLAGVGVRRVGVDAGVRDVVDHLAGGRRARGEGRVLVGPEVVARVDGDRDVDVALAPRPAGWSVPVEQLGAARRPAGVVAVDRAGRRWCTSSTRKLRTPAKVSLRSSVTCTSCRPSRPRWPPAAGRSACRCRHRCRSARRRPSWRSRSRGRSPTPRRCRRRPPSRRRGRCRRR